MAPPLWGGLANITNILVSFTGKFTDIPGFVSKLTNILVNLLVKLVNILVKPTRMNPKGGCHGSPWAQGIDTGRFAPALWVPWEPWAIMFLPGWPQGPMAPLLGGGNTLARGNAGEYSPYYSSGCALPGWPPKYSGTVRGSRRDLLGYY